MESRPEALAATRACATVGLAESTYYYARRAAASSVTAKRQVAEAALRDRIEELCLEFNRYGYRRVTAQLNRERFTAGTSSGNGSGNGTENGSGNGTENGSGKASADGRAQPINHKRVLRIMREESLLCHVKRAFVSTTQSGHGFRRYRNLIKGVELTHLNQVWVADLTYIRLQREFVYLAVILDSYSRRVIGWDLGNSLESALCGRALKMAIEKRRPPEGLAGLIHHSDQGVQYACAEYVTALEAVGAQISMSARGNPYENARAESFMKTLKHEEVYLIEHYDDLCHARERIGCFLEDVYNRKRLHSSLGYLPPEEFEERLGVARASAAHRPDQNQEIGFGNPGPGNLAAGSLPMKATTPAARGPNIVRGSAARVSEDPTSRNPPGAAKTSCMLQ